MEEIVPVKIDWKKFKKLFPNEASGWELPLNAKFPDRDLKGLHNSYGYAMDAMYSKLPSTLRKPLGLFVASTANLALECVQFEPYEIDAEFDPEEWMDAALPLLDPRKMKQVAAALAKVKALDYRAAIVAAWSKSTAVDDSEVTDRMATAQDFVDYLEHWIAAFDEIHHEGAVLGIAMA